MKFTDISVAERCDQMPVKNSQISPSTIVRAAQLLVATHSRQSCCGPEKANIRAIWSPSGESRFQRSPRIWPKSLSDD